MEYANVKYYLKDQIAQKVHVKMAVLEMEFVQKLVVNAMKVLETTIALLHVLLLAKMEEFVMNLQEYVNVQMVMEQQIVVIKFVLINAVEMEYVQQCKFVNAMKDIMEKIVVKEVKNALTIVQDEENVLLAVENVIVILVMVELIVQN